MPGIFLWYVGHSSLTGRVQVPAHTEVCMNIVLMDISCGVYASGCGQWIVFAVSWPYVQDSV